MAGSLTRWDPFQELASMRNVLDRVFDQGMGRLPVRNGDDLGDATLGLDVYETNEEYVVKAAIPGIDPKDVSIEVEDDVLTIKGETAESEDVKEETYLRRELRWGSFSRALRLPPTVDAENAQATFENGVLKLSLPKKAEAKSKTIKITPQGVIEGSKE